MAGTSDGQAAWQGLSLQVHVVEGRQCEAATPSPEPVVSTWPQCPDTDPDASGCRHGLGYRARGLGKEEHSCVILLVFPQD